MSRIRVLVVEDSLTVRRHLCDALAADSEIEVAGEAEDGKRAIELCAQLRPDAITLDMVLPVMSGLAATEYIMAHCPVPILIVSSSTNRADLFKTYEALAAGAVDVLEKPAGDAADQDWERKLVSRVKLISRIKVITHPRARLAAACAATTRLPVAVEPPSAQAPACRVVAIGASTGGPGAILEILRALPPEFPLPVLVVLHISEPFGSAFADWLDSQSSQRVGFARDGQQLQERGVFLAPPDRHVTLSHGRLRLSGGAERHSCRPSVDVLFESLARECGAQVAACLLTGMGRDGADGLLEIRQAGGCTIAQDEASCVVYGMPREAVAINAARRVLPLTEIGPALAALARPA